MTCLEPDLFDRLNSQIAHAQVQQLCLEFEILIGASTVFSSSRKGRELTIICNPDRLEAITAQRQEICQRGWEIAFIGTIQLYCEDKKLWTISSSKSCPKLEATRSFEQKGENMTVETPEKTAVSTSTPKRSTRKSSPVPSLSASSLEEQITALAHKTGKSESQILAGILNGIPEALVNEGLTKLIDQEIENEVEEFRRSKRTEFLTTSSSNGNGSRAKRSNAPQTPAKTKRRTPTADSSINQTRFRSFTKGARISTTLINFLSAQSYDAVKREEVIQAIANLPVTIHPEMAESFHEKCLTKILKVHRGGDRASVITAAQKLGSKTKPESEPVEATA